MGYSSSAQECKKLRAMLGVLHPTRLETTASDIYDIAANRTNKSYGMTLLGDFFRNGKLAPGIIAGKPTRLHRAALTVISCDLEKSYRDTDVGQRVHCLRALQHVCTYLAVGTMESLAAAIDSLGHSYEEEKRENFLASMTEKVAQLSEGQWGKRT